MAEPIEASQSTTHGEQHFDNVLQSIIAYVYHYSPITPEAIQRARVALCDALGCAIETSQTNSECGRFLGPLIPGTVNPCGFRVPGTAYQLDPVKGAFDMGSLIRYQDHNDALGGAEWGHPSDNLGAILAVADWLSRNRAHANPDTQLSPPEMTLQTVLVALVKAYEIQGGIQELNSFNSVGLDHTILVKISSTAVVSWLLGLSELEALAALSQAFQDGHPLRTFRQAPNTSSRKGWAAGDACSRAVFLSLLTRAHQTGAPTVLTDPNWGFNKVCFQGNEIKFKRPLGTNVIHRVAFKVFPAEGHGISAVEAALKLHDMLALRHLDVETDIHDINIRTQRPACVIINKQGALTSPADRDHCLQYMVAVALLKGSPIEACDYMDDSPWASDARVEKLRAKMSVREDRHFTEQYLDQDIQSCANALQVTLRGGEILPKVVVEFPLGHAKHAQTLSAVKSKFRRNLAVCFDKARIDEIESAVQRDDLPVHEFVDLVWRG